MGDDPKDLKPSNALEDFFKVLADFQSVSGWIVKASLSGPLISLAAGVSPPYPSKAIVAFASVVFAAVELMMAYEFGKTRPIAVIRRWMIWSSVPLIIGLLAYIVLLVGWTFNHPKDGLTAKGFVRQAYLQKPANSTDIKPDFRPWEESDDALLNSNNYEVDAIWTSGSIMGVQLSLLKSWIIFYASFSWFTGSFVLLRRRDIP